MRAVRFVSAGVMVMAMACLPAAQIALSALDQLCLIETSQTATDKTTVIKFCHIVEADVPAAEDFLNQLFAARAAAKASTTGPCTVTVSSGAPR